MIPQNARKGNGKKGRMKNWQRFKDWNEAYNYYLDHLTPTCTRMDWGVGSWLYLDYIEGESRLDLLRRLDKAHCGGTILTAVGRKELARLEKAAKES